MVLMTISLCDFRQNQYLEITAFSSFTVLRFSHFLLPCASLALYSINMLQYNKAVLPHTTAVIHKVWGFFIMPCLDIGFRYE